MRFTNSYSTHLGTYTWAELQAAYPNGGAALAALPTGVTVLVSDWGAHFSPNDAKTKWRAVGGKFTLAQDQGSLASPLATITGVTAITKFGITSIPVPANLTYAGVKIDCKAAFRKTGANAAWLWQLRMGTGDSASDPVVYDGSNNATATDTRIDSRALVTGATTLTSIRRGSANTTSVGYTTIDLSGGTLDATALQRLNFYITPSSAADTFALIDYQFVVEYPL